MIKVSVADQLYLSYWLRGFTEQNMLRHYEKMLKLFPFSRLARQPSVFKVLAVSYSEPVLLETLLQPPVAVEQVLASAKDFHNADSCYRLETWWDLWQYQADWELSPSRVALCCLGPQFDREEGEDLLVEFGIDAHFLPQSGLPNSARMAQSNLKSLLKLVHDLDDALQVERRQLWSESGENFSEQLRQALSGN